MSIRETVLKHSKSFLTLSCIGVFASYMTYNYAYEQKRDMQNFMAEQQSVFDARNNILSVIEYSNGLYGALGFQSTSAAKSLDTKIDTEVALRDIYKTKAALSESSENKIAPIMSKLNRLEDSIKNEKYEKKDQGVLISIRYMEAASSLNDYTVRELKSINKEIFKYKIDERCDLVGNVSSYNRIMDNSLNAGVVSAFGVLLSVIGSLSIRRQKYT